MKKSAQATNVMLSDGCNITRFNDIVILIYLAECRDEYGGQQNCSKHIFPTNHGPPCHVNDCSNSSCHSLSGCSNNACMILIIFSLSGLQR